MSLSAERKLTISTGWQPKVQHQPLPGSEANLEPQPLYDQVPTCDGVALLHVWKDGFGEVEEGCAWDCQ